MWGSNARETHPIFFHHVLKGVRNGAKLYARRPAALVHRQVGRRLARHPRRHRHLARQRDRPTRSSPPAWRTRSSSGAPRPASRSTGSSSPSTRSSAPSATPACPAELIRQLAHDYARADRAQICWTLGITEHHNAADNVLALINLALLTGHVGRYGSGLEPLRGQNNVQGGGDMGAIPNKLPGFQDVEVDHDARRRFGEKYGVTIPPKKGWHLSEMFDAMERGELTLRLRHRREPDAAPRRTRPHPQAARGPRLPGRAGHRPDRRPPRSADVVLPGTASWCESEGTVTNSERRVQRVRKAIEPPAGARDDIWIIAELARRLGHDWGEPDAEDLWDELRSTVARCTRGMSYEKLERLGGVQWPCPDEESAGRAVPARPAVGGGPGQARRARPVPPGRAGRPARHAHDEYPIRLTTGRRLDSYNTGVQTDAFTTPLRRKEALDLSPEDAERLGLADGDVRPGHLAPRLDRGAGAGRRDAAAGARVHDAALPRPGGDQHAHDRRQGPQVGHRRVQGDRDPGGEGVSPRRTAAALDDG